MKMIIAFALMVFVFAQSADAAEVASIQRALAERGFDPGPVDGLPGRRTTQALRDFQKANGLPETGDTDADTLVLLGLIEPSETPENSANAEETAAATEANVPEAAPTPIKGDLDTAMALFGQQATEFVMQEFMAGTGIPVVTTDGFPLTIDFIDPDPAGKIGNTRVDGVNYDVDDVTVIAQKLSAKPAISFALELFTQPGMTLPAPDDLCADMPISNIGIPVTHICITGGAMEFGGKIMGERNEVSCVGGGIAVTNANRNQSFREGTRCKVNGNVVEFTPDGWKAASG